MRKAIAFLTLAVCLAIAVVVFLFFFAFLAGCPPHPAPTPGPAPGDGFDQCAPGVELYSSDLCEHRFTSDGKACVRCRNVKGCIDRPEQIYCVGAAGCDDPVCRYIVGP